jgi:hypothetical protein
MSRKAFMMMGVALLAMATGLLAQKKDKSDPNIRSVEGTVRSADDTLIVGAVVQLKDTKSLQVRSFITKDDGTFHFQGLSPNVDYELKAEYQGNSSDTKTLSVFDSRTKAVIHLRISKK